MAIRKEGKEVQDNMDYKSAKEKMQEGNRIKKVDVFNLRDYFKYKDAIQNDKDLKDVFPSDYPIKQLDFISSVAYRPRPSIGDFLIVRDFGRGLYIW